MRHGDLLRANTVDSVAVVRTNRPDYYRNYNGFELSAMKRYADRWSASVSYAYNDAVENYALPASYEDPTNIEQSNGDEFAPESSGSGIDNIFTNAKWLVKANGLYTMWGTSVSPATSGTARATPSRRPSRAQRGRTARAARPSS